MFSGSDATESQGYTQWPLNASAYHGMQNEQVDWAALAHQWIKMKDAGPPPPLNVPPPPPIISGTPPPPVPVPLPPPPNLSGSGAVANKGEAPVDMDVENDSDSNDGSPWGGGSSWVSASAASPAWPPAVVTPAMLNKPPLLPTPTHAYSTFNTNEESYSPKQSWSAATGNGHSVTRPSTQSRIMKPHNKRFSKVNVPLKTPQAPSIGPQHDSTSPTPTIDANKRKQLPAWIREGLEKMERDKLREMDRSRKEIADDADEERRKLLREDALEILKSTRVSKTDNSDDEEENSTPPPRTTPQISTPPPVLTHEEMMLKVRRTMTEILLKVTNREIATICKEEHQRHTRKLKAYDQRIAAPSAGANLSARLGLGAYGSGESSSESEVDEERNEQDSDNELREIIRRRREAFEKVEREIEERLAEVEAEKDPEAKTRPSSDSEDSSSKSSPAKSERRSATPRVAREKGRERKASRSTSSSSSPERRRSRTRRRRSSSSSSRRSRRRRDSKRRHSRSRSRSRRADRDRRRRSRSRSRRSSRSRNRHHRRSRSRTRSRSPYDGGRGFTQGARPTRTSFF